jgi:hypothetical protein
VGGPFNNPRAATHIRAILPGVTYSPPVTFSVAGTDYVRSDDVTYGLLARFWSPGGGRPVFLLGGLTAGANLAAARYLATRHRELERRFGPDRPFCLVLRIVEPAAYRGPGRRRMRTWTFLLRAGTARSR